MRWTILILLMSCAPLNLGLAQTGTTSPCNDSIYVALRRRPVDSLSVREYALFQERDRACIQLMTQQGSPSGASTSPRAGAVAVPPTAGVPIGQAVFTDNNRSAKDGTTATLFSLLIVGGGQMYAGEVGKGLGLLGGAIGAVALGYSSSAGSCDSYGENCNVAPLAVGEVVAFGLWLYGVVDAHSAVERVSMYASATTRSGFLGLRIAIR